MLPIPSKLGFHNLDGVWCEWLASMASMVNHIPHPANYRVGLNTPCGTLKCSSMIGFYMNTWTTLLNPIDRIITIINLISNAQKMTKIGVYELHLLVVLIARSLVIGRLLWWKFYAEKVMENDGYDIYLPLNNLLKR